MTTHLDAVVSIPLHALKDLERQIEKLTAENAQLGQDVVDAKLGGPDATARLLHDAFLDALPVISFAVANLPPLAVRGWPYAALRAVMQKVAIIPGAPVVYAEVKNDFILFAAECERWERARAEGKEREMFAEETARRAVGPTNVAPEDELIDLNAPPGIHVHTYINGVCTARLSDGTECGARTTAPL